MQATSDTRPKKFVFTLMPFSEAFDDIYKLGIKAACESAGAYCERIDEQIFNENILLRLYNQINKADLIVSDMTDRNPNVFYETGYAHALNKKVILLTQNADDIPFDLKHYPHIVYSGKIVFLKDELQRRVQWYLDQPEQAVTDRTLALKYYLNKQAIEEERQISVRAFGGGGRDLSRIINLEFALHNPTFEFIDASNTYFSIIIKEENQKLERDRHQSPEDILQPTLLPDGTWLVEPINFSRLLPQGWDSRSFYIPWSLKGGTAIHPVLLRISSESGVRDINLFLEIEARH
jgi:hypothetical protein